MRHRPHVIALGLEDSPRGLLSLSMELFQLPANPGVHGLVGHLRLAIRRPGLSLDRSAKLSSSAGPLDGGHDRPQRELEQALGLRAIRRVCHGRRRRYWK